MLCHRLDSKLLYAQELWTPSGVRLTNFDQLKAQASANCPIIVTCGEAFDAEAFKALDVAKPELASSSINGHPTSSKKGTTFSRTSAGDLINVGDLLVVTGLTNNPRYNGRFARAVNFNQAKDLWTVWIEGETTRFACRPTNLEKPPKGTPVARSSSPLKPPPGHHSSVGKAKTSRPKTSPSPKKPPSPKSPKGKPSPPKKLLGGNADPSAAGGSAVSVGSRELSESEREAARARLLAPTSASFFGWRPKVALTQRAEETDEAALAEGTEERPEFKVQMGKRRTRAAKTTRTERTVSRAASQHARLLASSPCHLAPSCHHRLSMASPILARLPPVEPLRTAKS